MKIIIDSTINIKLADLPAKAALNLKNRLTRSNPDRHNMERLGFSTRGIPTKLHMYTLDEHGYIHVDRAMLNHLEAVLTEFKIDPEFESQMVSEKIKDFPDFKGTLESYQADALAKVTKSQGLFDIATAGGKTVLSIALFAKLKQKTLVLVHTKDLLNQWVDRCKTFLPKVDVGVWAGGKKYLGKHITIATFQSMKDMPTDHLKSFGLLLVDEVHHVAAPVYRSVISSIPAKYRYGVTATVKRKDNKDFYVRSMFGETIVKYGYDEISDRIILPSVTVSPVPNTFSEDDLKKVLIHTEEEAYDFNELDDLIYKDPVRNSHILKLCVDLTREGRKTLLIVKRIEHAKILAKALQDYKVKAVAAHSNLPKQEREAVLISARAGEIDVLVGTSIADEGLDIPQLDALVLGVPTFFDGRLVQRIGRVIRISAGKTSAIVHDLVDVNIPILVNAYMKRRAFYQKHGFELYQPPEVSAITDGAPISVTMV